MFQSKPEIECCVYLALPVYRVHVCMSLCRRLCVHVVMCTHTHTQTVETGKGSKQERKLRPIATNAVCRYRTSRNTQLTTTNRRRKNQTPLFINRGAEKEQSSCRDLNHHHRYEET